MKDVFSIDNFNILEDNENYYFFRALSPSDSRDIKKGITATDGKIDRIRTHRERWNGKPKYYEDSEISLEEVYDHIKVRHEYNTNCISLTSNSNVGIIYGRKHYSDDYVIVKVPKKEMDDQTVVAGAYMIRETEKRIDEIIKNKQLDKNIIQKLNKIDSVKTQKELDRLIKPKETEEKEIKTEEIFKKGIDFDNNSAAASEYYEVGYNEENESNTQSADYSALNDEQNFIKNKLVAKIDLINDNIIPSISNTKLIKTIGLAFSSLELIHYKDVKQSEIIEPSTELIDILSILQQVPRDSSNIEELKQEILKYAQEGNKRLNRYVYKDNKLDEDADYTIDKMYKLTDGNIDFYTATSTYEKSYYLAKSKLRTKHLVELIRKITNNDSKYDEIIKYIEDNTYGIEPSIFRRRNTDKIKISESVGLSFNKNEEELFDLIDGLEDYTLRSIIKDPLKSLQHVLREVSYVEDNKVDKESYYANAIIDAFDWRKLNISKIYHDQRVDIVDKLKEKECVKVYNKLKKQGVKEDDISNVLLTTIIKDKDINDIDLEDTFTVEELEDFLGYYKIKDTDSLKLRNYQASALENIDELFEENQFAAAVLPTGAGKSFVALAKMLENPNDEILYLAPNVEILHQIKVYIRDNVVGKANSTGKSLDEIIKSKFPNLKLHTYAYLKEDNAKDIREGKYDLIVFDEIHRTGAAEWSKYIEETINNQSEKTKVLGISATPQRDMDYKDMSNIWAERFGYSKEDIRKQKHLAINMDIIEGIKAGYIAHPRVISCAYTLKSSGKLEELKERIDLMSDSEDKKEKTKRYEKLRRDVDKADGIETILKDNLKEKGKYIVFIPVTRRENGIYEDEDGNKIEAVDAKRFIQAYENQMKQYIFAGKYIDENIEEFKEIEKQLKKKEFSPDVLKWINKEKENIQALSRIRTLESNNELLSKTNEIAEAILERMDWEELDDSKKGKLLNDRTKEYIENYSMSSSYTDTHNTNQLENFNSSDSNKIKFMFVMNKLNEGVHVKGIDGIIWLRPMDENSKILYLQQLGRCIYGLDPNEEVPEEERPLVIDFVNNTLSVNLAKGDMPEIKDLNALRIIVDYIEQRGNPVLDINSTNKLEKQYAKALKRISDKYNQYISDTNLIEELDFERKDAITEIIKEGSKIDLWHMTFPEEIKSKKDSSKEESEDDILELFSITGIAKDFLELSEDVDKSAYISREEKAEEFIKSVHELKRNVKDKQQNNGKSERVFRDGTDQRSFYNVERKKYNKIDFTKPLTPEEKATKERFESMQEAVNQYEVNLSREEKAEEFIKSVHELKRNVKGKKQNNGKSERVFRDGTDQRSFYENEQVKYNKIDFTKPLTSEEKATKEIFESMQEAVNQYEVNMSREEKAEEFIKSVHELKRNVKDKQQNNGKSERVFRDGTDQRSFYNVEQIKYNKIDFTKPLTPEEKVTKERFESMQEAVNQYEVNLSREEKAEEFIKSVHELKRNVKIKSSNNGESERVFRDGTDQRNFYNVEQKKYNKIDFTKPLTSEEKATKEIFESMQEAVNQYEVNMSREEKVEEFIKSVHELKRNVKGKKQNNGKSELVFRDGTDQRSFYNVEQKKYNKIDLTKPLTSEEQETKEIYENMYFALGYVHCQKYLETYGDLKVISNYKCQDRFKLREFLDEQRRIFKKKKKTEVELEREKKLFDLYPGWVTGRIDDVVSSKVEEVTNNKSSKR